MGFTTRIDHERREIYATAEGSITLEDIRQHLLEGQQKGALSYPEVCDARTAQPHFSASDVRAVVETMRALSKESPLGAAAIIVDSDLAFGMMRMLEMLVGDVCPLRPFRTPAEADWWLDNLRGQNAAGQAPA
jgi:hypothetical protein